MENTSAPDGEFDDEPGADACDAYHPYDTYADATDTVSEPEAEPDR
ncbi:hypothetical protein NKH77_22865 [Streptomyces sp. M19]